MYQIVYYLDGHIENYNYLFNSLWAAIFKARAIHEQHGISTDVINTKTGEILVGFYEDDTIYTDNDLEVDLQVLARTPLV